MLNVKVNGNAIRKAQTVSLRRLSDDVVFCICSPCVLRLSDGLVHVIGEPQEELDTNIWDVRQKFDVLEIAPYKE
jgi:hypothetical protein